MVEIYISAYQVEIGKPLANDVLHWSSLERKSCFFFYNFAKVRELSQDGENDIHLLKKIHVLFYVFEALSLTGKIGKVVWLFFCMDGFSAFSGQFSLHCPCSNARD